MDTKTEANSQSQPNCQPLKQSYHVQKVLMRVPFSVSRCGLWPLIKVSAELADRTLRYVPESTKKQRPDLSQITAPTCHQRPQLSKGIGPGVSLNQKGAKSNAVLSSFTKVH